MKFPVSLTAVLAMVAWGILCSSTAQAQKKTAGKEPSVIQPVEANKQPGVSTTGPKARESDKKAPEADLEAKPIGAPSDKELPRGPTTGDFLRAIGWLAVVIALIVAVVAALKRFMPAGIPSKGGSYVQVLSRTHLTPKHSIYVVKCGAKLILVGMTPTNLSCLGILHPTDISTNNDAPMDEKGFQEAINGAQAEMASPESGASRDQSTEDIRRELRSIIEKVSDWRANS